MILSMVIAAAESCGFRHRICEARQALGSWRRLLQGAGRDSLVAESGFPLPGAGGDWHALPPHVEAPPYVTDTDVIALSGSLPPSPFCGEGHFVQSVKSDLPSAPADPRDRPCRLRSMG